MSVILVQQVVPILAAHPATAASQPGHFRKNSRGTSLEVTKEVHVMKQCSLLKETIVRRLLEKPKSELGVLLLFFFVVVLFGFYLSEKQSMVNLVSGFDH